MGFLGGRGDSKEIHCENRHLFSAWESFQVFGKSLLKKCIDPLSVAIGHVLFLCCVDKRKKTSTHFDKCSFHAARWQRYRMSVESAVEREHPCWGNSAFFAVRWLTAAKVGKHLRHCFVAVRPRNHGKIHVWGEVSGGRKLYTRPW